MNDVRGMHGEPEPDSELRGALEHLVDLHLEPRLELVQQSGEGGAHDAGAHQQNVSWMRLDFHGVGKFRSAQDSPGSLIWIIVQRIGGVQTISL